MEERHGVILDPTVLEDLRSLQAPGEPSVLAQVIHAYLKNAQPLLEVLRGYSGSHQQESLRIAAHTLKSSSANVGALRLSGMCRRLEECCVEGVTENVDRLISAILVEFERALEPLKREMATDDL
jgi:HPt (histidine-containing phosphotransfer) domain-containing protein